MSGRSARRHQEQKMTTGSTTARQFTRDLATIGLHGPTVVTGQFALFTNLPVRGEILLVGDEARELRLLAVSTLFDKGWVVHTFQARSGDIVIVALSFEDGGPIAWAVKPRGRDWQAAVDAAWSALFGEGSKRVA
jgi:hypothetical protein